MWIENQSEKHDPRNHTNEHEKVALFRVISCDFVDRSYGSSATETSRNYDTKDRRAVLEFFLTPEDTRTLVSIDSRAVGAQEFKAMKPPRFLLRGFRRPSDVASAALGHLERQTLEEIWRREETSVRDIFISFEKRVAYTTLMTTLDRLFKKGFLSRRKDGRAFLYSALVTSEEFEQRIAEDVIDGLLGQSQEAVEPILACIVDTISDHDRKLLNELDRLIKQKRLELGEKG